MFFLFTALNLQRFLDFTIRISSTYIQKLGVHNPAGKSGIYSLEVETSYITVTFNLFYTQSSWKLLALSLLLCLRTVCLIGSVSHLAAGEPGEHHHEPLQCQQCHGHGELYSFVITFFRSCFRVKSSAIW